MRNEESLTSVHQISNGAPIFPGPSGFARQPPHLRRRPLKLSKNRATARKRSPLNKGDYRGFLGRLIQRLMIQRRLPPSSPPLEKGGRSETSGLLGCLYIFSQFFMPRCGATTDENHVAQTALSAVCGFSSPNCPTAADLPEMQEVCATRSYFHRSFRPWGELWLRRDHPPRLAPRPLS